jgi:hypothetical protein
VGDLELENMNFPFWRAEGREIGSSGVLLDILGVAFDESFL